MKKINTILLFVALSLLYSATTLAQFTSGNIVAVRIGDGAAALTNASTAVFLDEFTVGGTLVQSVAMPTSASGSNAAFTNSGTATSEGQMTRSANGRYLILSGYGAAPGTASISGTASTTVNRVVARVDATGTMDITTKLTDAYSANNIRGATSVDGTGFWISGTGTNPGVRYASLGATTSTQLSTTITNIRVVNVFNNQLYCTSATGTFQGVSSVGSGTPTSSGETITLLNGFPTAAGPSPYSFAVNSAGTVIYVADDRANGNGGVQKWTYSGGTWSLAYTHTASATTGCRGVVVDWFGTNPIIYATSTDNKIQTVTDAGSAGTLTTLATAATNTAFRGIAFAPYATVTFTNGSLYAAPDGIPNTNDNPVGRFYLAGNISGGKISSITVKLSGTYSGVSALKLYSSTSSTFNVGSSTLLATTTDGATATFTISGGHSIFTSGEYFFIAADLNNSASGKVQASVEDETKLLFTNAALFATFSNQNLSTTEVPLPVELVSFTAKQKGKTVRLHWQTATETNNAGFEIERASVGRELAWTKIGFVEGAGSTNSTTNYSFTERASEGRYLYRLKQIDRNGNFNYSNSVEVVISNMPQEFSLSQNYPNPFNPSTVIQYQLPMNSFVSLKVYDMLGKEIAILVSEELQAGKYSVTFNASGMSSGVYFYKLQSGNFSQVQMMMILK